MIFEESPLRDLYRRAVWGPWRLVLERLPDGAEIRVNQGLGALAGWVSGGNRRRVEANLRRAFPGRSGIPAIARETFVTHFANQYLPFSFGRLDAANASRYLRFEGLEHLEAARGRGGGVVVMHPHMGPAQLPLCVLGLRGYPMHQVGGGEVTRLSPTGEWAASVRHSLEERMPVVLLDGKSYLRPVLRVLSEGAVVMSACDGTGGGKELGRRARAIVCGQVMHMPVGPLWLALRSGAPLLTLHTVPDPLGVSLFVTTIGPEIALPRDLPLAQGLEVGATRVAGYLTRVLTSHPGSWHFWDQFEPGRFLAEGDRA